jgi:hypothetical protein
MFSMFLMFSMCSMLIGVASFSQDLGDHIGEQHLFERRASVSNNASADNTLVSNNLQRTSASTGASSARAYKRRSSTSTNSTFGRHLKANDWFRHDDNGAGTTTRPTTLAASPSVSKRRNVNSNNNNTTSNGSQSPAKVWRMTHRPPASPAARQAAEEKFSRKAYAGAAGVSARDADRRQAVQRSGRKHVVRTNNNLFHNMQYPQGTQ